MIWYCILSAIVVFWIGWRLGREYERSKTVVMLVKGDGDPVVDNYIESLMQTTVYLNGKELWKVN